jgi:hypothetical protein
VIQFDDIVGHRAGGNHAHQHHRSGRSQPPRTAAVMRWRTQQPANPVQQGSAGDRKGKTSSVTAQGFQIGERASVGVRIAAQAHGQIVAAVLALDSDSVR